MQDRQAGPGDVPADVHRALGVAAFGRIVFAIGENGAVGVRPVPVRVAELRGIVPALTDRETIDFDDLITEAFAKLGE